MKIGIIIETKDYEKAWNAFRFAVAAKTQNNVVKVFLLGDAVKCDRSLPISNYGWLSKNGWMGRQSIDFLISNQIYTTTYRENKLSRINKDVF